ncbi:MAG: 3-hydroxyacyl-ACP dehydratase [Hylemonella sp.]
MNAIRHSLQLPAQHPSYAGHFPGQPIVPGVLLLEAIVQAAEQLGIAGGAALEIPVCKFSASLLPGATVELTLTPGPGGSVAFAVTQGDRPVASGSLRWQESA